MPPKDLDAILDNEREWRRIIYADVQRIKDDVSGLRVWNLVWRATGTTLFGLFVAYVSKKLGG